MCVCVYVCLCVCLCLKEELRFSRCYHDNIRWSTFLNRYRFGRLTCNLHQNLVYISIHWQRLSQLEQAFPLHDLSFLFTLFITYLIAFLLFFPSRQSEHTNRLTDLSADHITEPICINSLSKNYYSSVELHT